MIRMNGIGSKKLILLNTKTNVCCYWSHVLWFFTSSTIEATWRISLKCLPSICFLFTVSSGQNVWYVIWSLDCMKWMSHLFISSQPKFFFNGSSIAACGNLSKNGMNDFLFYHQCLPLNNDMRLNFKLYTSLLINRHSNTRTHNLWAIHFDGLFCRNENVKKLVFLDQPWTRSQNLMAFMICWFNARFSILNTMLSFDWVFR